MGAKVRVTLEIEADIDCLGCLPVTIALNQEADSSLLYS